MLPEDGLSKCGILGKFSQTLTSPGWVLGGRL